MTQSIKQLLQQLGQRPIAFHRAFVGVGRGVCGAVFLSQLFYWSSRTPDPDGWVYHTAEKWYDETGLTRREQDRARQALKDAGVVEEMLRGVPPIVHYRIDLDRLAELLIAEAAEAANQFVQNVQIDLPPDLNLYGTYKSIGTERTNLLLETKEETKVVEVARAREATGQVDDDETTTTTIDDDQVDADFDNALGIKHATDDQQRRTRLFMYLERRLKQDLLERYSKAHRGVVSKWYAGKSAELDVLTREMVDYAIDAAAGNTEGDSINYVLRTLNRCLADPGGYADEPARNGKSQVLGQPRPQSAVSGHRGASAATLAAAEGRALTNPNPTPTSERPLTACQYPDCDRRVFTKYCDKHGDIATRFAELHPRLRQSALDLNQPNKQQGEITSDD